MTADQACAPRPPELELADQARSDCPRLCAAGLPPDALEVAAQILGPRYASGGKAAATSGSAPRSIVPSARRPQAEFVRPVDEQLSGSRKTDGAA